MVVVSILVTWGALSLLFSGVGLLTAKLLGDDASDLSGTFWLGWAGTIVFLLGWCLVLPIDNASCLAVGGLALLGFGVGARRAWLAKVRGSAVWLLPLAPVALWMAELARQAPTNGDSRMYHLPAVAWAEAFPVVPGLANLHGRLGFNNASTLFHALLDHGPWAGGEFHIAHGLLLLPLYARGLPALWRLVAERGGARDAIDAVLLAFAVDSTIGANLTSTSPDLPVGVLEAVLVSELAGWIERQRPRSALPGLTLLCAALLTVKLSALGFAAGMVLSLFLLGRDSSGRSPSHADEGVRAPGRRLAVGRVWAAFILPLALWTIRGVILTGYPAYPSTLGGVPVDWRVPTARAIEETNVILAWGRRPGVPWEKVLASSDWVGPWLRSTLLLNRDVTIPVLLGMALLLAAWWLGKRGALWLLALPPLLELMWWFVGSPDPRFAGASFWLLPAVAAALLVPTGARFVAILASALVLWPLTTEPSARPPQGGGLVPTAAVKVSEQRTESGLVVWVPDGSALCWPAPLLCTPTFHGDLTQRMAGNLRSGFAAGRQP